jgi:hypothetical protein
VIKADVGVHVRVHEKLILISRERDKKVAHAHGVGSTCATFLVLSFLLFVVLSHDCASVKHTHRNYFEDGGGLICYVH